MPFDKQEQYDRIQDNNLHLYTEGIFVYKKYVKFFILISNKMKKFKEQKWKEAHSSGNYRYRRR